MAYSREGVVVRFNVYIKFKGMDGTVAVIPSSFNPFQFENLALALSAMSLKLPDYTSVGVTPVGITIESVTDPIMFGPVGQVKGA